VSPRPRRVGRVAHALKGQTKAAPRMPIVAVACPDCGAAVGEQCHSASGRRSVHMSRKRMAARVQAAKS
jgi:hypothetical protein